MDLRPDFFEALVKLSNRHSCSVAESRRAWILLHYHDQSPCFKHAAKTLGVHRDTVSEWYHRGVVMNRRWTETLEQILKEPGHAQHEERKERLVKALLADKLRPGAPCTYSLEQYTRIVSLALKPPSEFGRPITHWTSRELADEVNAQNVASGISERQVGRFLAQGSIKPHKSRYWLNPKIDDQTEYEAQVKELCEIYLKAPTLAAEGVRIVSTDEKTGVQALERCAPLKPLLPGKIERIEHDYKRHGTLCVIPSFDVAKGQIIHTRIGETRNEIDFAAHVAATIATDPGKRWIFICDQLNTHMSESLVRLVAEKIEHTGDLGKKYERGVLKSKDSRKAFLRNTEHAVRFVYTPRHCSWLNQVEIWFGILVKKVLKRGSFSSKADLRNKIEAFIDYFNRTMAKPFKWTYKGKPLAA